jgi:hypothetical protein
MSRDELLDELRDLDLRLRGPEMIQFVKQQELKFRAQFAADLATLSASIGIIENAQLAEILGRLNPLASQLKTGIQELQDSIDSLDKTVAVFTEIGNVVGLAARVAGLVA